MLKELVHNIPFMFGAVVTILGLSFKKVWVIVVGIIVMVVALAM